MMAIGISFTGHVVCELLLLFADRSIYSNLIEKPREAANIDRSSKGGNHQSAADPNPLARREWQSSKDRDRAPECDTVHYCCRLLNRTCSVTVIAPPSPSQRATAPNSLCNAEVSIRISLLMRNHHPPDYAQCVSQAMAQAPKKPNLASQKLYREPCRVKGLPDRLTATATPFFGLASTTTFFPLGRGFGGGSACL